MRISSFASVLGATVICLGCSGTKASGEPAWTSPTNRYRILLDVDPGGLERSHAPVAPLRVDFQAKLALHHAAGTFDEHTVEVISYDDAGRPLVYDATRPGYEQYLVPHRLDQYYGIDACDLVFVMPDASRRSYAVYFDTVESGRGQPERYAGLVGDGDYFREGYKRRAINACHFDAFADLDGDGDLDLFEAGVEPFVYCYENVGGNRFVDRGRLTSGGDLFVLPKSEGSNRSWMSLAFHDWDGDGDQDFFPSFGDGPDAGRIIFYRNVTSEHGGVLTFSRVGPLQTVSGTTVPGGISAGGWFPVPTFVPDFDGDGDGLTDVLVGSNHHCYLYRNLGSDGAGGWRLADPVALQAGGADIVLTNPRFEMADIDGDNDLDLFAGTQPGQIHFFENVDTSTPRTNPTFAASEIIAFGEAYFIADAHSAVKVADFTGDGLLDYVVGRFWERSLLAYPEAPREYGWLYENVGSGTAPDFVKHDGQNGATYTERFQICDAVRQNGVRAVDWDNDGRLDLLAGDTDGYVWYFRNEGSRLTPVFATGVKLQAGGEVLCVSGSGGHARHDICDWNNDGRKDLIIGDGQGQVRLYLNEGTDENPVLAAGQRVEAGGTPIDRGGRSSVLVCDWNHDGNKDLIFADQDQGFVYCRNVGSDASPELAAPTGLGLALYTRPNLGDFVDWDGDGKKDFIGCNFENNIRLYRDVGSGQPGATPQFADPSGVLIVVPYTVMTCSGADALDFNGDGDLDILTGQGHGGSGLRYYERDYIDNCLNDSHPVALALQSQQRPTPDFDGDGDVDLVDFGTLQLCLSGEGKVFAEGCAEHDLDGDLDVDQDDLAGFLNCLAGADVEPGC